ncbi:PREDICTED: zinc transporter ZIP14-like, partial [Priapulus caudatus]|uniref:Zinc transporter ZIP14-like n=1 Tax=Priapulus caudatus TaxID=37621 RepID=A0ABM1F1V7_PRICU
MAATCDYGLAFQEVISQCLSSHDLVYLRDRGVTNDDQVARLCPDVIRRQEVDTRCKPRDNRDGSDTKPTLAEVWGYGVLSVTLISLCSLTGILLLPIMAKNLYKQILSFFIALGVGSLAGSAVFHLIPEALGLADVDPDKTYLWKLVLAAGGIYVFFLADRIMKIHLGNKQMRKEAKHGARILHNESTASSLNITPSNDVVGLRIIHLPEEKNGHVGNHDHTLVLEAEPSELSHGHTHGTFDPEESVIAAVAWMIIFGDGLHNFVDGLSIGAAFADDLWIGISLSVAVFCEEFPHEL